MIGYSCVKYNATLDSSGNLLFHPPNSDRTSDVVLGERGHRTLVVTAVKDDDFRTFYANVKFGPLSPFCRWVCPSLKKNLCVELYIMSCLVRVGSVNRIGDKTARTVLYCLDPVSNLSCALQLFSLK